MSDRLLIWYYSMYTLKSNSDFILKKQYEIVAQLACNRDRGVVGIDPRLQATGLQTLIFQIHFTQIHVVLEREGRRRPGNIQAFS
jgi:hypothetical protein